MISQKHEESLYFLFLQENKVYIVVLYLFLTDIILITNFFFGKIYMLTY